MTLFTNVSLVEIVLTRLEKISYVQILSFVAKCPINNNNNDNKITERANFDRYEYIHKYI